jgi:hypothetical protein
MFNQQELQILLGGVNSPIDLDDLRAHTQYGGLYSDQEPTIQVFWRVCLNVIHIVDNSLIHVTCRSLTPLIMNNVVRYCALQRAVVGLHFCKLAPISK